MFAANKPAQTATTNPPAGGLFGNNPQPAKLDQPQKKDNPPANTTGNIFGQNNSTTTGGTGQTGNKPLFNNQPATNNPTTNPPPANQANQGGPSIFSNQNKPAETTGQQNPT